jgi:hypothetical protein
MPGGLIQIVAYGSQDLYLTSIPEITFFKVVYRKYTNFAMESIEVPLNGTPKFDSRFVTVLPKVGDLIHKLYLKVNIPAVNLIASPSDIPIDNSAVITAKNSLAANQLLLAKYIQFFKYNYIILNGLLLEAKTLGSDWHTFKILIIKYKNDLQLTINTVGVILDDVLSKFDSSFPESSKDTYYGTDSKNEALLEAVKSFVANMNLYYSKEERILLDLIADIKQGIVNITTLHEHFAWIERLGFFIINKCSIMIGGQEIVAMDSNFLDIYYSLNNKEHLYGLLDEMIGNIPALTSYTNKQKEAKTLYIPIPTWFSEHSGNALPIISLVYHDVEVNIEFSSLDKCCIYNGKSNINNLIQLGECSLLVDYIFLGTDERKKFGQFQHEYLVQSVQTITSAAHNISEVAVDLDFFHPVKELIWYAREQNNLLNNKLFNRYHVVNVYNIVFISRTEDNEIDETVSNSRLSDLITIYYNRTNGNGNVYNKGDIVNIKYSKYYDGKYPVVYATHDYIVLQAKYVEYVNYHDGNYGIIFNEAKQNSYNPIETEYITFNGIHRTPNVDFMYYNGVVPYQTYKHETYPGINTYAFSLRPDQFQPSGSCNFSLIKSKTLQVKLNDNFYNYIVEQESEYKMVMYAINYNILRIHNGIASLVFSG